MAPRVGAGSYRMAPRVPSIVVSDGMDRDAHFPSIKGNNQLYTLMSPEFQDSKISRFQDLKISRFQAFLGGRTIPGGVSSWMTEPVLTFHKRK